MSTYTSNLGIEKPQTGQQSGTWGSTVNTNFDIIDRAISGSATLTLVAAGTSGSPNTVTITDGALSEAGHAYLEIDDGGDLAAAAYIQIGPNDAKRIIRFKNNLSGDRSIFFFQGTYDAARDYELENGNTAVLIFNGGGTSAEVIDGLSSIQVDGASIDGATVTGSTIDSTAIGGTTPSTAAVTSLTINNEYVESTRVSTSGGALDLDPSLGTVWRLTLSSSVTFTDDLANGESMVLIVSDGTDYTITWPTMQWINGSAPQLDETNQTVLTIWKVDDTLFGSLVGVFF